SEVGVNGRDAWPPGVAELAKAVGDVVAPEWEGSVEICGVPGEEYAYAGAIDALDFLTLKCTPSAPHHVILTPSMISGYQTVFAFLLRLLRAEEALSRVILSKWWRDQHRIPAQPRIRRAWEVEDDFASTAYEGDYKSGLELMHLSQVFVTGLMRYAFGVGVGEVWAPFRKALDIVAARNHGARHNATDDVDVEATRIADSITDLSSLHALHAQHMDRMNSRLFLKRNQAPVRKIIDGMVQICLDFARMAAAPTPGASTRFTVNRNKDARMRELCGAFKLR
ncbi:hypothetical protein HK104_008107, partial [Borealophlyctis nickersoniae]